MSDEKMVTILNRGARHYDHGVDAKGQPIRHAPGALMAFPADKAAAMLNYRDLVDVSKMPGTVDTTELKAENKSLLAEAEKLKAEIAALKGGAKEAKEEPAPAPKQKKGRDSAE